MKQARRWRGGSGRDLPGPAPGPAGPSLGSDWGDRSCRDGKTPGLNRKEHPAPNAHIKPRVQLNSSSKYCKEVIFHCEQTSSIKLPVASLASYCHLTPPSREPGPGAGEGATAQGRGWQVSTSSSAGGEGQQDRAVEISFLCPISLPPLRHGSA